MRHRYRAQVVVAALPLLWQVPAQPHWRAPLLGPIQVVRPFVRPVGPYAAGHRGVDLAAPPGAVVLAAGSGTVSFAGRVGDRDVVVVRHDPRTSTEYEPVTGTVLVGVAVPAGAPLGVLQSSRGHCGAVTCLHWGLRRDGRYEDPMTLLRPPVPVLLPFLDDPAPGGPSRPKPGPQPGSEPRPVPSGAPVSPLTAAGAAAATAGLGAACGPPLARRLRRARPAA